MRIGRARPSSALGAAAPVGTGDFCFRMRPEVQVLPGPPPALTSRNAGCFVRRPSGRGVFGIKTSYLVTVPCHESALLSSGDFGSSVRRRGGNQDGDALPGPAGIEVGWRLAFGGYGEQG